MIHGLAFAAVILANDPLTPVQAGLADPPSWWVAAIREETARPIAADLPATPMRFRFQCAAAQARRVAPFNYVPPKCIQANDGLVSDPVQFARQAALEAAQPALTATDRLRRAAWLRVMVLYSTSDTPAENARTFVVEEAIAASDLAATEAALGQTTSADLIYEVPPHPEYSRAALRDGVEGTVKLTCRSERQFLSCRTTEARTFVELARPDGSLSIAAQSYYFLLHDVHNAMQGVRVAPLTKSGLTVEGLEITTSLSFRLE